MTNEERPIVFSTAMVNALLEGRKTQTRTMMKLPPNSSYTVGDRLWVQESLRGVVDTTIDDGETMPIAAYQADGSHIWTKDKFRVPWRWAQPYLSPSQMPRKLSRITLEITAVRVERLNEKWLWVLEFTRV